MAYIYPGYPIQEGDRDPTLPEYYITINGFLSNGTAISLTIPSDTGDITTTDGSEEVTGTWGTVGSFHLEPDFSSWTVNFTAEEYGLTGKIVFIPNSAEHHFACNTTKEPYFSGAVESLVSNGTTLSDAEDILYNQLGWATTIPGESEFNGHKPDVSPSYTTILLHPCPEETIICMIIWEGVLPTISFDALIVAVALTGFVD